MDNNNRKNIADKNIETTPEESLTKTKKKTKKRYIILFILLAILLGIVGFVVYTVGFHTPDTGVNNPPPFATDGLFDTTDKSEGDQTPSTETQPNETQPDDPSELPKSKQKIYNFLLIGQDRVALNTDVIMIVNFNTTTHKINVLQIPRDTYIEISTYSGKINGVFAQYYLNSGRNIKTGARKFADTLEQNLCIKIHNVIHVNLNGVQKIVNALGGVDVNLPQDFTYYEENTNNPITLKAGVQHLDGYMAEQFIRHRSTYLQADIGRMDAQKIFMSGLIKKFKSSFNISTVAKLADIVFDNINTDLSLADGIFYAKELLNVDMSEINFMSMVGRGSMSNPDGTGLSFYIMIRKNMCEMIDKYFNIYDFPITDAIFDANRVFTSTNKYPHLNQYYTNPNISTKDPYTAGDINDSSISIPHV